MRERNGRDEIFYGRDEKKCSSSSLGGGINASSFRLLRRVMVRGSASHMCVFVCVCMCVCVCVCVCMEALLPALVEEVTLVCVCVCVCVCL